MERVHIFGMAQLAVSTLFCFPRRAGVLSTPAEVAKIARDAGSPSWPYLAKYGMRGLIL